MRIAWAALGAVVVLLAGCGSDSSDPAADTSTPVTQTTTSSETWTINEAARQYLAMTKQGNADLDRLQKLNDSSSLDDVTTICRALADDTHAMLPTARSDQWPDQVKPLMKAWAKAVADERSGFVRCGKASSIAEAAAAITTIASKNSADETALVKTALGLGPSA
jgi:hypothetical protein